MAKLIGVVRHPRTVEAVPPAVAGLRGCSLYLPTEGEATADPGVAGVWMLWLDDPDACDPSLFDAGYVVDEDRRWDRGPAAAEEAPAPGITRLVFLRARPGLTRSQFAEHWRDVHSALAHRHHPALVRYTQNVVVSALTAGEAEVDGIAELSFRSVADMRERMYDSDEGRRIIGHDVRKFIDVAAGWRVLTMEQELRRPRSNAF